MQITINTENAHCQQTSSHKQTLPLTDHRVAATATLSYSNTSCYWNCECGLQTGAFSLEGLLCKQKEFSYKYSQWKCLSFICLVIVFLKENSRQYKTKIYNYLTLSALHSFYQEGTKTFLKFQNKRTKYRYNSNSLILQQ